MQPPGQPRQNRPVRRHHLHQRHLWQLTTRLSNVFRYSYTRFRANQFPLATLGLPTYIRDNANVLFYLNFNFGFTAVGGRADNNQLRDTQLVQNQLVWTRGKHNLRAGGEYRLYRFYPFQVFNPVGSYSFGANFTQQDHLAAANPSPASSSSPAISATNASKPSPPTTINSALTSRTIGASQAARANVVAGQQAKIDYDVARANARDFDPRCACTKPWFNTAAFAVAPEFTIPNGPRFLPNVRSDYTRNWDASLTKRVKIGESISAVIQVDAFNVFNAVYFGAPNGNPTSNFFGSTTGINSAPRRLQLGAKIQF